MHPYPLRLPDELHAALAAEAAALGISLNAYLILLLATCAIIQVHRA